jgi:hypothetical protein
MVGAGTSGVLPGLSPPHTREATGTSGNPNAPKSRAVTCRSGGSLKALLLLLSCGSAPREPPGYGPF